MVSNYPKEFEAGCESFLKSWSMFKAQGWIMFALITMCRALPGEIYATSEKSRTFKLQMQLKGSPWVGKGGFVVTVSLPPKTLGRNENLIGQGG